MLRSIICNRPIKMLRSILCNTPIKMLRSILCNRPIKMLLSILCNRPIKMLASILWNGPIKMLASVTEVHLFVLFAQPSYNKWIFYLLLLYWSRNSQIWSLVRVSMISIRVFSSVPKPWSRKIKPDAITCKPYEEML